jgi:ribosomal protein L11 methyltransferase
LGKVWPALDISVPGCDPELQDFVLAEIDDFHPTAIEERDGEGIRAFFGSSGERDAAAGAVKSAFGHHLIVTPADIDDEDWAVRSQEGLEPVVVGRLTIVQEKGTGLSPLIVIRPSMGFGTGHHATTRLMLAALQEIDVAFKTVLDVGCGSGVLTIAAAVLGARAALGVDCDPDALESAAENLSLNAMGDRVVLQLKDLADLSTPANVVLANLTGGLLERNAERLAALVVPGGQLVVSGFLDTELGVIPAFERFLSLQETWSEDEWRCAAFTK